MDNFLLRYAHLKLVDCGCVIFGCLEYIMQQVFSSYIKLIMHAHIVVLWGIGMNMSLEGSQ